MLNKSISPYIHLLQSLSFSLNKAKYKALSYPKTSDSKAKSLRYNRQNGFNEK